MAIGFEDVKSAIGEVIGDVKGIVSEKPLATAAIGAGAAAVGTGLAVAAITRKKSKRKTTKRGRKRDRIFKSKQQHEQRYKRKRKYKVYGKKGYIYKVYGKKGYITPKKRKAKTSRKGKKVYYARKTGQPYILLASGKAKFIKGKRRKTR